MARSTLARALTVIGATLLLYALLGNYLVLPGYLRFLAREESGDVPSTAAFVIGAVKTISWMLSVQLAVLCLGTAHALRAGLRAGWFAGAMIVWIGLWSIPSLPAPDGWFYAGFGALLLVAIGWSLAQGRPPVSAGNGRLAFLFAISFFALATWEVCGLGSAGRMLRPEEATDFSVNLLVTQSSKLMIELVIAWIALALSLRGRGGASNI